MDHHIPYEAMIWLLDSLGLGPDIGHLKRIVLDRFTTEFRYLRLRKDHCCGKLTLYLYQLFSLIILCVHLLLLLLLYTGSVDKGLTTSSDIVWLKLCSIRVHVLTSTT